jgi:predicted O-methyltransferase YrrM
MKRKLLNFTLLIGAPITLISTIWLKFVAKRGINKLSDKIFMYIGLLPVLDHYYQPLINPKKHLKKSLRDDRVLRGVNFNTQEQLELLNKFNYNSELINFPLNKTNLTEFYYNHSSYKSGDAEYLYNIVRYFKPRRIIEIGCGNSTLMISNALKTNQLENQEYNCNHICIEPFEQPWLESIDVELIREKIEDIDISFFQKLNKNDILFIDSSHIIRPQGDVLYEYLEILPILNPGVIVHVHDIFTPKDYLDNWIHDHHLFWNEQYLFEAFMTYNSEYKVIGALNYLTHHYRDELADKCPIFANQPEREPGAFWIVKK